MTTKGNNAVLVGIAGASGSGKSTLARKLEQQLRSHRVIHLLSDNYYRDTSHLTLEQRNRRNYDHPDSIDIELLIDHLKELHKGNSIDQPVYDFSTHNRTSETVAIGPASIVLLDGILIFAVPQLREILDIKLYVETPLDICFIRRLQRDVRERGRSVESVVNQYLETVRPMFLEFVNPSKKFADMVIKGEGDMEGDTQKVLKLIFS